MAGRLNRRRIGSAAAALSIGIALSGCSSDDGADEATSEGDCREVEHVLGTACIPADPQRIVTIDPIGALPTLLDLDVPVVGASAVYNEADPFPDYLDPADTEGIEVVGTSAEPDFEAIAVLEPDLIIGSELYVSQFQDRLEDIAPTVAVHDTFYTSELPEVLASIADLVGKADEFETKWSDFQARQDDLREQLAATYPDGLTVSRVDGYPDTTYAYRWSCIWFGTVLSPLGLTEPEQQQAECDVYADWSSAVIEVADENIGILDADVIFGFSASLDGSQAAPFGDSLATSPLWNTLSAVQEGKVFEFGDAWGVGASLPAAEQILDDVESALLP